MGRIAFHPLGPGNWPVTSPWRGPGRPDHRGIDLGCFKKPLYASVTGRATRGSEAGAGWWVNIISDDGRILTKCFHMSRIDIAQNERVTAGQRIGISGGVPGEPGAGNTGGAHLHYEIWENGRDTNPAPDLAAVAGVSSGAPTPEQPKPLPPIPDMEDDMAASDGLYWQENAGELWFVSGNTKLYIASNNGVDAEKWKADAIDKGVPDHTKKPAAQFLELLRKV